jgi:tetratricopeptide (TPR) repeat protein
MQSPIKWLLVTLSVLLTVPVFAQYDAFEAANMAYQKKEYQAAIDGYAELLNNGQESTALHYNLANAYYRTNELGPAILHYERALRLSPNDKDIAHNLEVARAKVPGEGADIQGFKEWTTALRTFSSDGWGGVGLVLIWLGVAGLVLWQTGKSRTYRKWGFLAGVTLLVLSLLPFTMAYLRSQTDANHDQAIVVQEQAVLHSAPDEKSQEVKPISEGAKVQVLDVIGEWYKVQANDGEQGWLPGGVFERI